MNTRRQIIISEVTQRNKRLKTSAGGGGDIPIDLLFEIFLRLSTKSIAICRCVSKLWSSVPGLPSFTELFLSRFSARPRLLFACHNNVNNEVFFFSCTQPHVVDENLSLLTATYHMKIPCTIFGFQKISPISGLIFLRDARILKGREHRVSVVCNPSTGQTWTLPIVKTRNRTGVTSYFGCDPVKKQHKVLSMTAKINTGAFEDHQVLTLGTGELSWRRIKCSVPHRPSFKYNQVCINGVIYYTAFHLVYSFSDQLIIVCFDVKSEKFSFIKYVEFTTTEYGVTPLINCNGKLGFLSQNNSEYGYKYVCGRSRSITLWVLEDVERQEWSKNIYILPSIWQNIVGDDTLLRFVGVTQSKEIVLSTCSPFVPYYIFFYDIEIETITRVEIQGMEAFKAWDMYISI